MTHTPLPDDSDIWPQVFECYFSDKAYNPSEDWRTRDAVQLVQVCKGWKASAERFIYQDLYFEDTSDRVQRAAYVLRGRSEKLSRWTRTLTLELGYNASERLSNSAMDACAAIALHARELVQLRVSSVAPPNALLAVVAAVAPTSLRRLYLSWQTPGMSALMLSYIGAFPKLRTLKLESFEPRDDLAILPGPLPLSEVDGWVLHELERLDIDLEGLPSNLRLEIFCFLSRCVLGKPDNLHLRLQGLTSVDTAGLEMFFRRHITLSRCRLGEPDALSMILSHVDTRYLHLDNFEPSVLAAVGWSPRLQTICIDPLFHLEPQLAVTQLEMLMRTFEDYASHGREPLRLHLLSFHWMPVRTVNVPHDVRRLALVGAMYRCARTLLPKGITVIDSRGYTLDGSHYQVDDPSV